MRTVTAIGVAAAIALVPGCQREERDFDKTPIRSNPRAEADGIADLQPGQPGRGMRPTASAGGYNEGSAYEVAQGKQWFRWYNCVGCHAQGGGAIGPALMDDKWIYGSAPDAIFATIVDGRPNGMPSFRGRIPEVQVWQLVAYVRSMSGLVSADSAPNRSDGLAGAPPEGRRNPTRPDEKKPK
jgi:cytochrome c oxidase cbb3-type subunit 3